MAHRLKTSDVQLYLILGWPPVDTVAALKAQGLLQTVFQPVPQTFTNGKKFTTQGKRKMKSQKAFHFIIFFIWW